MTDKERREEYALENLIQTAYEFSDDQILKELEETEATLSDSDFPGIEDRIYQKLKARLAEKEAAEEIKTETVEEEPEEKMEVKADAVEVSADTAPTVAAPTVATQTSEEPKVVRLGKRKAVVVGILAAAFVGTLGVTAIGEKNYFFRDIGSSIGVIVNNDKNFEYYSSLEDAYEKIEINLGIPALRLGYIPKGMKMIFIDIFDDNAEIAFDYNGNIIHFYQEKLIDEASIGINSDRELLNEIIYNEWISENFLLEQEIIGENKIGYAAILNLDNARYRIIGQIDIDILKKIIKSLTF